MSRIDEIKEKIKWSSYHGDIEYLLSTIEMAEKNLEKILDEQARKFLTDKELAPIYREIAIITLEKLRS